MLQVIPNFIAMTSQVLIVLALTFLINLDLANGIYSNITAFRCVIFSSTTWCWANPRKPPLENISFI